MYVVSNTTPTHVTHTLTHTRTHIENTSSICMISAKNIALIPQRTEAISVCWQLQTSVFATFSAQPKLRCGEKEKNASLSLPPKPASKPHRTAHRVVVMKFPCSLCRRATRAQRVLHVMHACRSSVHIVPHTQWNGWLWWCQAAVEMGFFPTGLAVLASQPHTNRHTHSHTRQRVRCGKYVFIITQPEHDAGISHIISRA